MSFKACVSLLIFSVDYLCIGVSGVLKSPNVIVFLLSSPVMAVSVCLMYWGAPMLGTYLFTVVTSFSWIDPLVIMWCPTLSLITVFVLKSILCDMSIATPTSFWFPFAWNIFSIPLLSVCMCPWVWSGSLVDSIYIYGSCCYIHSANLCALIGVFNPFKFTVIKDMYVPIAIFLTALGLFL